MNDFIQTRCLENIRSEGDLLRCTAHRPIPLPPGPWLHTQTWIDVLFAHWPLPPSQLRDLVPTPLELETFDKHAWVGIVPFEVVRARPRGLPAPPYFSHFPEINVRTYVSYQGQPGVYFFSLNADSLLAVEGARLIYRLNYYDSEIHIARRDTGISYDARRRGRRQGRFRARYGPTENDVHQARPGTLEHWLTERYCLYAVSRSGQVFRGPIHHRPWQLQAAWSEIEENSLPSLDGIILPAGAPLLHYAAEQPTLVWAPQRAA